MPTDSPPTATTSSTGPRRFWHVPVAGFVGAVVLAAPTLTPSLLPHAPAIQGVVTGLAAACGYLLGLLVAFLVGVVTRRRLTGCGSRRVWAWLAPAGIGVLALAVFLGESWQSQLRSVMGAAPSADTWWLATAVAALGICGLLVTVGRAVRRLSSRVARAAAAHGAGPRVASGLGVILTAVVTMAVSAGLVVAAFGALQLVFAQLNEGTTEGVTQPTSLPVSGSHRSAVSWESLGTDGRDFVTGAPSRARISTFTGDAALDPIRVYAGVQSADTAPGRAQLAVDDLERFGGFDRDVLVVATSTGTGFIDPTAIEPLEIMYGGDTAVVSMQYSTLPSWLSFLVDQERAANAGAALFEAVHARWIELPADRRPRLLVFGESLGAFGAESAFADLAALRSQTGGVQLVGPPDASELHRQLTQQRDAGSPQWQPIVAEGAQVRFGTEPEDLDQPPAPWSDPRVAYLQNASDPVVWWTPRLLWSRPDWLEEPAAPSTWQHQIWLPVVTFLKVTGDMMNSTSVPVGHGHVYGWHQIGAWARIAPPPGWTDADTARLEAEFR